MVEASKGREAVLVTDFLDLIRKVITVDDTIKQYFSEEQLADLAERRAELGEQAITDVEEAWPELMGEVQAAVDDGVDPATPRAQELAARWEGLVAQFHGGNEGLRDSLDRMYAENAAQIEQQQGGPSPALLEFIKAASADRA
jgi:hypothetical protein